MANPLLRVIGWAFAAPVILFVILALFILALWAGAWAGNEIVDFINGAFHE